MFNKLKEYTISQNDLFRFINNRSANIANFSMLLGAGCSISSGIMSANQLVNKWKLELYKEKCINANDSPSNEEIESFLKDNSLAPDNIENQYSFYFETRYPLEKQRVIFIENQIDNEKVCPSIGYACLVEIAQKKFIDVFFTTNFDDLLNESFYIFDNQEHRRPLVYFEDSKILTASLNSSRIKIFKLHGDYLYGKMKITEKETADLSQHSLLELETISKERGLIVIGYSGNDKSIMGALNNIIKNEQNYENGIFWCIRKGETLSKYVEAFFESECLKEKKFIVEIDNFDDFILSLYIYLGMGRNPISKASSEIKRKILQLYSTHNSEYSDNINYILQTIRNEELNSDSESSNYITEDRKTIKKFSNIAFLMIDKNYSAALEEIEEKLQKETDKESLLHLKAECLYFLNRDEEALSILLEQLKINPYNVNDYVNACLCEKDQENRIKILDKGLTFVQCSINLLNIKAQELIKNDENNINLFFKYAASPNPEVIKLLEKSDNIDKSVNNDAWKILFDYLFKYAIKTNEYENCKKIVGYYLDRVPYSISVLTRYAYIMHYADKKTFKSIADFIDEKRIRNHKDDFRYESIKINIASIINSYTEIIIFCKTDFQIEDISVVLKKAELIYTKLRKPELAIRCLSNVLNKKESASIAKYLIKIYLDQDKWKEAEELIKKHNLRYDEYEERILTAKEDYLNLEIYWNNKIQKDRTNLTYLAGYSHALLLQNKFAEAYDFCAEALKSLPRYTGILAINYYLAKQMNKGRITAEPNINRMASSDEESFVTAAACYMKNDHKMTDKADQIIINLLNKDFSCLEYILHCYVFKKYIPKKEIDDRIISKLNYISITEEDINDIVKNFN